MVEKQRYMNYKQNQTFKIVVNYKLNYQMNRLIELFMIWPRKLLIQNILIIECMFL